MTASAENDAELLERISRGDQAAFDALYRSYYRRLFGYLLRITHRPDLVEDVLNEVMLVVWRQAGRFEGRSKVSTWIFGIAYRRALKALASDQRHGTGEELDLERLQDPDRPDRNLDRLEARRTLREALGELSPVHRAVVEMTYYLELSYAEIAEIMGCPVNTVKTRMFHARKRLRRLLPALGLGEPVEGDRS